MTIHPKDFVTLPHSLEGDGGARIVFFPASCRKILNDKHFLRIKVYFISVNLFFT